METVRVFEGSGSGTVLLNGGTLRARDNEADFLGGFEVGDVTTGTGGAFFDSNGHAIGIGLTIALQADFRIVAEDAKYAVVQVRGGVLPDCMSHWTLTQLTTLGVAADILLTDDFYNGKPFELALWRYANEIRQHGLLLKVLPLRKDAPIHLAPEAWPIFEPGESAHQSVRTVERVMLSAASVRIQPDGSGAR